MAGLSQTRTRFYPTKITQLRLPSKTKLEKANATQSNMILSTKNHTIASGDRPRWHAVAGFGWVLLWVLMLLSSSLTHAHAHACCDERQHNHSSPTETCCIGSDGAHGHTSGSDSSQPHHHHHSACCQAPVFAHNPQMPIVFKSLTINIHKVLWFDQTLPDSPVFELDVPPRILLSA